MAGTAGDDRPGRRRAASARAGPVRRLDPAADRTVVATTIGLVTETGDDDPVTLSPEMATMFTVSADGADAAMTTSAGHLAGLGRRDR